MLRLPRNLPGMDAAPPPPNRPHRPSAPPLSGRLVTLAPSDGLDELARWAASERVNDAAQSRAEQRRHNAAEASQATVASLLTRLSESARPVLVDTVAGNRMRGRIATTGTDFCIITAASGPVMVPTAAIAAVGEAPGPLGNRPTPDPPPFEIETAGATFSEALAALAAERPLVQIAAGGRNWRGQLASAGADIVSVSAEPGSADTATSHIAIAAIDHLTILAR